MTRALLRAFVALITTLVWTAGPASAQDDTSGEAESAFSLSSSQIFTSKDAPHVYLTFRHLSSLDFRVYKVRDPFAFFAGLRQLHEMGTYGTPDVPQEPTLIERLANWKRGQRSALRGFVRGQISREYRAQRTASSDRAQAAQRTRLNVSTFAQVPLLNSGQLVTSWRELLPDHRDAEMRRVPLDVKEPGVYVVEAVNGLLRAYAISVVSDLGLVTKTSPGQIVMFAADRFTGEPAADCDVRIMAAQKTLAQGRTTATGTFEAPLPEVRADEVLGLARCSEQIGVTDPGSYGLGEPPRELVGYIYTDKPIYRPGHTVHTKAVLRWRERDALRVFDVAQAELVVSDVNDKVLFRQRLDVDRFGAVQATVPIPATAALGRYSIKVTSGDREATGAFEVQEYRRPEFEVVATPASRFVVQGQPVVVTVQARYYFGQPVANGQLRWVVNEQGYQSPLRWNDDVEDEGPGYFYGDDQTQQGTVRLDANGRAELRIALPPRSGDTAGDFSARVEAQVTDASGRQVSGTTIVHLTRGTFLLSTRTDTSVLAPGATVSATVDALDYLGTAQRGVTVSFALQRVEYRSGYYNEPVITTVATAQAVTDAMGHAAAPLPLPAGVAGTFRVVATATSAGRSINDFAYVWVPGAREGEVADSESYLELIADRRSYAPGDTAKLVVRGEPVSGPIFVTKEGQHVSWYQVVRQNGGNPIEVPVAAGDEGDVYVSLTYLRDGRLFRAERRLGVPAVQRTLQVTVTADQAVARPRDPGTFTVRVADHTGAPVQAQLSLAVIDEAVYGVKPDDTPDPVRFFYRREYTRVNTTFSRDYYFTGYSGRDRLQLASRRRRPFTLADFKGDKPAQPQVRKEFPDAIYWLGDLVTNAAGEARVAVKYPDTLTTWRLTARAVTTDTRAGSTVARTTTTKDLIVRVITPRFLTEGDDVVLPTLVHNYREDAKTATVTMAATGLQPAGSAPTPLTAALSANGERRDDWRFAARSVGTAVVTAAATTDSDSDAVELPLPVVPYGVRREATASGSLVGAGEATASVTVPEASNPAARSISVALAPSMAGSLLGALDFLTGYPYGCTEQTLSSFLPNLLVTRALTELKLAPTERLTALDRMVSAGVQRLGEMQHQDGGWGWWPNDANHPFMTAYAVWGLDEARRAGVKVESYKIFNGTRALAQQYAQYPRAVPDLKAYMVYVLQRAGGESATVPWFAEGARGEYRHATGRDEAWASRDRMSAYGRALLLLALDDAKDGRANELAAALEAEAVTTGDLSYWTSETDPLLQDNVQTRVEATALAVQALVARNPRSPLLERAVRYLLVNRTGGYWGSTKQTAMAIYGLLAFMRARGETSPQPFAVDVLVNGTLAGRTSFTAASLTSPDPEIVTVPAKAGTNDVRIVKRDGGGTVYWSAVGRYYDTVSAAARQGSRQLAITRRYAVLTPVTVQNRIVYRETPFTGTAKPGDVLTVRLTVAGSRDWRYLAIEDPIPAGVESVQDTTAYPLETPNANWWWGSRVEYRDQRTVFFQEGFDAGRYEYLYFVKVTSTGAFRAAPAQVSPMYVPGVMASSEPLTLTVAAAATP
jgi:alpha-2-macroglobulin